MRDDDYRHALFLQLLEHLEEHVHLVRVQGGGGLVQDEDTRLHGHGLGYLDHALGAGHEKLHQHIRVHVDMQALKIFYSLFAGLAAVYGADTARGLNIHNYVVHYTHRRDEREVLICYRHAELPGSGAGAYTDGLAVYFYGAFVGIN